MRSQNGIRHRFRVPFPRHGAHDTTVAALVRGTPLPILQLLQRLLAVILNPHAVDSDREDGRAGGQGGFEGVDMFLKTFHLHQVIRNITQ